MNDKKLKKTQNIVKKAMIGNFIFLGFITILFFILYTINSKRVKLIIDKKEIKNGAQVFKNKNGKTYVDLNILFTGLNSYKINNGVYGSATENKDSFYIETPYEALQFTSGTKNMDKSVILDFQDRLLDKATGKVTLTDEEKKANKEKPEPRQKTPIDDAIISNEEFKLKNPIYKEGAKVYASVEDLKYILNAKITVKGPETYISTVDELEKKVASYLNKNNLSMSILYQNRKAIVDDYFVASTEGGLSGVYKYDTKSGLVENIIGPQYEEIRYIQSEENMYFTTTDKKLGLKSLTNLEDIIKAGDYEGISIYFKDEGLYLAKKNKKLGVINSSGKVIVPLEYDQIGLVENEDKKLEAAKKDDEKEEKKIDKESKIIMDKFIPVMQKTNSKGDVWRLVLKDGSAFTDLDYVSIGYKVPTYVEPNERGMIEIPEEKKELAKKLKISTYSLSIDNVRDLKKLGLTTNKANVIDGAQDLIYIPEDYLNSGVVVEIYDPTESINTSRYGIIRSDFSKDTQNDPFTYPAVVERIYKKEEEGETKYYAEIANFQDEFLKGEEGTKRRVISRENVTLIDPEEERKKALKRASEAKQTEEKN